MEDMRSVIEEAVKSAEELYQEGYLGLYEKLYQEMSEEEHTKYLLEYPARICGEIEKQYGLIRYEICRKEEMKLIYQRMIAGVAVRLKEEPERLQEYVPLIQYLDEKNDLYRQIAGIGEIEENLKKLSVKILKGLRVRVGQSHALPEYDRESEMMADFERAEGSYEFNDIYEFLDACERGNGLMVYFTTPILKLYVRFLYEKAQNGLIRIVNDMDQTVLLHYLSRLLDYGQQVTVAVGTTNKRYWFEALRAATYMLPKTIDGVLVVKEYLKQYKSLLLNCTGDLDLWTHMLKYFGCFPSRAPGFYYLLGECMEEMSSDAVRAAAEIISLEMVNERIENQKWEVFLMNRENALSGVNGKIFLEVIFERWQRMIKEDREYLLEEIHTTVDGLAGKYIQEQMTEEEKSKQYSMYAEQLRELPNEWFYSKSKQQIRYYQLKTYLRFFQTGKGIRSAD